MQTQIALPAEADAYLMPDDLDAARAYWGVSANYDALGRRFSRSSAHPVALALERALDDPRIDIQVGANDAADVWLCGCFLGTYVPKDEETRARMYDITYYFAERLPNTYPPCLDSLESRYAWIVLSFTFLPALQGLTPDDDGDYVLDVTITPQGGGE